MRARALHSSCLPSLLILAFASLLGACSIGSTPIHSGPFGRICITYLKHIGGEGGWRGSPPRCVRRLEGEKFQGLLEIEEGPLSGKGRQDPCVLPRAPPLLGGMAAIMLAGASGRGAARPPSLGGPALKKAKTA